MWAVEPSEQMRVYLEEDRGALPPDASARIRVVTGNWPEVQAEVPPVEVALASLVIHFYADAAGFLKGMVRAATRRCVLAIRAGQMEPLAARLWPLFHPDRPAPTQPVLRDVLAVMEEVGLHPDVRTHAPARPYGRYPSREEARSRLAAMLRLDPGSQTAAMDWVGDAWCRWARATAAAARSIPTDRVSPTLKPAGPSESTPASTGPRHWPTAKATVIPAPGTGGGSIP